jgi:hypothetical protein
MKSRIFCSAHAIILRTSTRRVLAGPMLTNVWVNYDELNNQRVGVLHLALIRALRPMLPCWAAGSTGQSSTPPPARTLPAASERIRSRGCAPAYSLIDTVR